jgi:hypothetical protein
MTYNRDRDRRRLDNERRLMGETLADFHARERATQGKLGTHLSRAACPLTPDLFNGLRKGKTTADLFDQPTKQRD